MKKAMACDYEGDALLLAKAARIVQILSVTKVSILMANLVLTVVNRSQCHLHLTQSCLCC